VRRWILVFVALAAPFAWADKGHIWPRPVGLSESSQKAIILHNRDEEILILGVELQAQTKAEILEFIPFPSEPKVTLAEGNPFERAGRLIHAKRLEIEGRHPVKGGAASRAAVEIRFSEKVGLHDVTVIKINDTKGLIEWVNAFFRGKGIEAKPELDRIIPVAEDYLRRGFPYFVFDYVPVQPETKFIEALAYRFKTERLYYPLKTSNIVGGKGAVEAILLLPGSFVFESEPEKEMRFWTKLRALSGTNSDAWRLSSSAKIVPAEAKELYPEAERFFRKTPKLYLQVFEFRGEYRFDDDLLLELGLLAPYAYKLPAMDFGSQGYFFDKFSTEEIKDYCEAKPDSPMSKLWLAETKRSQKKKK